MGADVASFAAFGEVIGPAAAAAGLDAKPLVYPAEGTIARDGPARPIERRPSPPGSTSAG